METTERRTSLFDIATGPVLDSGVELILAWFAILFVLPLIILASPLLLLAWAVDRFLQWLDKEPMATGTSIRDRHGRRTDLGMWVK